jgi:CRP-like cAMP-binding protein
MLKLIVQRIQETSKKVEMFAFQPVAGRLANLILNRYGHMSGKTFTREMTWDSIADKVGTSRVQVSRIFNRFADQDLIRTTRTDSN